MLLFSIFDEVEWTSIMLRFGMKYLLLWHCNDDLIVALNHDVFMIYTYFTENPFELLGFFDDFYYGLMFNLCDC